MSKSGNLAGYHIAGSGHKAGLYQFLSTGGDGTGTVNAIGDYSTGTTDFYILPPAGSTYIIERMVVHIQDSTGWRMEHYGNLSAALTNGIQVEKRDASTLLLSLTAGLPVKNNAGWGQRCHDVVPITSVGDDFLSVRWTFGKGGTPIRLRSSLAERLTCRLSDDMTGLVNHTFFAHGRIS